MSARPAGSVGQVPIELWFLVGSMALIEMLLSSADGGLIGTADWRAIAFGFGAFWRPVLTGELPPLMAGQAWTMFLSHAFLHGSLLHLLMNGAILLSLGKFIADYTGPWPMLLLFAVSAAAGGFAFALLADTQGPMIGASGAAFGFLGLWQYWEAMARWSKGTTLRPVLGTLGGLVIINVVMTLAMQGGLAWQAHLGGFIAGAAMGPAMTRFARHHAAG